MKMWKRIMLVLVVILLGGAYSYGEWSMPIYNTDVGTGLYENTGALEQDIAFEQLFTCYDEGFCGLSVKLTKLDHPVIGEYNWEIQDVETGEIVGTGMIDESTTENRLFESSSALKRGNILLHFPKQKDSAGKEYMFTIREEDAGSDETMAVYLTEMNENSSSLKVGSRIMDKAGVIKLSYQRFNYETFIVFLGIMVYLAVFIKFIYKLFR